MCGHYHMSTAKDNNLLLLLLLQFALTSKTKERER